MIEILGRPRASHSRGSEVGGSCTSRVAGRLGWEFVDVAVAVAMSWGRWACRMLGKGVWVVKIAEKVVGGGGIS